MARKKKDDKIRQHKIKSDVMRVRLTEEETDALTHDIIAENELRIRELNKPFDPITGVGAPPQPRFEFNIAEIKWLLPESMREISMIRHLMACGSIKQFCRQFELEGKEEYIKWQLILARCRHDFCFWAASFATIKNKKGGEDIRFVLNAPQRKTLAVLENMRLRNKPIRMIILKARQWGGSTLVQVYMAWIQLMLKENWNSAIIAHINSASLNIRAMYMRLIEAYPATMLNLIDQAPLSLTPFNSSRVDYTITQNRKRVRKSVISVGSMQSPDTIRSFDIALVHFSEVGLWRKTDGKSPEDTIQAVSSSVLNEPLTLVVMESTAKGENNLFHDEWRSAVNGESDKVPVFVPWYEIENYRTPFESDDERFQFARNLIACRLHEKAKTMREQPGKYLWWLWEKGATLEAIKWYVTQRRAYRAHSSMASEFPSDDIEAFAHSGTPIFDRYKVNALRADCFSPKWLGELHANDVMGPNALENIHFRADTQGNLRIWEMPDNSFRHQNRYIVAVDVGGRSDKADYSDIIVFDRWPRTNGEGDKVVAEWHGHVRHDILAWKMVQIAAYYCNALLVVESNTFETRDIDTEGEHTPYILDQIGTTYRNMYTRQSSPENIRMGRGRKWGFQTNVHTKALVIDNLIAVIEDKLYTEREEEAIKEYNVYQRDDKGGMNAAEGFHDDRVMARAIGLFISGSSMPMPRKINAERFNRKKYANRKVNESYF